MLTQLTRRSHWWIVMSTVGVLIYLSSALTPWQEQWPYLRVVGYPLVVVEKLWLGTTDHLYSMWTKYVYLIGVEENNRELRKNYEILQARLLESEHKARQVSKYRQLLQVRDSLDGKAVAAAVGPLHNSGGFATLRIYKGRDHELKEGMPVLFTKGLVGQIIRSDYGFADIQLITSPGASVDITVERTLLRGVIIGTGQQDRMQWRPSQYADIRVGDILLTSGMMGIYPGGIPVAEVIQITATEDAHFQDILLKPLENVHKLEYVFVLQHENAVLGRLLLTEPQPSMLQHSAAGIPSPQNKIAKGQGPTD